MATEKEKTVCDLLIDVSNALYYVGEEAKPKEVDYPQYSELYRQVEDLIKEIGCKIGGKRHE